MFGISIEVVLFATFKTILVFKNSDIASWSLFVQELS